MILYLVTKSWFQNSLNDNNLFINDIIQMSSYFFTNNVPKYENFGDKYGILT